MDSMDRRRMNDFLSKINVIARSLTRIASALEKIAEGPETFVADGVRYYRIKSEPQMTMDRGCSRCKHKDSCIDRDMPNAIHCNNYGKDTQMESLAGMPEYIRWHDAYNLMDCCSMEVQDDNGDDID